MEILESGTGELFSKNTVQEVRDWTRKHKSRALVDKRMSAKDAIRKFVKDGDYLAIGGFGLIRIPTVLLYEIVRQGISDLSVAGHTTGHDIDLLIAGGCVSNVDVGYIVGYELLGLSKNQRRAYESGEVKLVDWTNGVLSWRLKAGAMGIPFLPVKSMLGTDTFKRSAAKSAKCPFTGDKMALVPALNPDVVVCHVSRCDIYGNAQIDGAVVKDDLSTRASKRVIMTTEEIVDTEVIRQEPWRTVIPYYLVDAVIETPWGSHPGNMPRHYFMDVPFIKKYMAAGKDPAKLSKWVEEYIHSIPDHNEYLRMLGMERLLGLRDLEFLREHKGVEE